MLWYGWYAILVEKEKKTFHKPGQAPVEKVFDMPYCSNYKWRTFSDSMIHCHSSIVT
jgi:hypothetical protein